MILRIKILCKIFISILFLSNSLSFAQHHDIQFETITIADGIGDAVGVLDILQDERGFIWIATIDGLARYDGYSFKSYLHDPYDSTSISTNRVFALCEADGYLWIGSQYQGLDRFDPVSEEFKRYHNDPEDSTLIGISWIFDIIKGENCLWIGTMGEGLFKFDLKSETFTQYKNDPMDNSTIADDRINKLLVDGNGNLWIGLGGITGAVNSSSGLDRFDLKSNRFFHYKNEKDNENSLADNSVWGIAEDSLGNLYVGTNKSILHIYDKEYDKFIRLTQNDKGEPFAPKGSGWNLFRPQVSSILADSYGYLWIGTMSGGLNRFYYKSGVVQHFSADQNTEHGLISNNIMRIYEDNQSTIWIPMNISGLTKVIPSQNRFFKFGASSKNSNIMIDSYVYALYQDSKGLIWIGTNDGEIYSFDQRTNSFKDYTSNIPQVAREVNVFFEDSRGTLWAGMRGIQDMAWRLNSNSDQFEKFNPDNNDKYWSDILNIIEDEEGSLWFSTEYDGIYEFNEERKVIDQYTRNWEQPEPRSISHTKVYSSLYDSKGNHWFGTYNGLNLFNPESKDFDSFLLTNSIWSLFEDSKERFWIGSRFRGLILFDRETKQVIEQFTTDDGLSSNAIYGITEDSQGFIWIMTPPGLTRLDTKSMTFTVFDESDGIANYFTDDPDALVKLKNGQILFGGKFGITGVNPEQFNVNKYPPKIAISKLHIFDKPYNERGMLDSDIKLDYSQNDLTIDYVGLHFKDPKQNKYKYMLEPYESDWKEAGTIRSARYTNLDPGKYTFKVTASNSDGVWAEKYSALNIVIVPPWWNTKTAYFLYLLAAFGFLYSIRRFELGRQRKNAAIKESKLRAETAELQAKAAEAQAKVIQAENERKTKELEEARKLQISMLPKEIPQLPNLEIAVHMKTATEVGGDYYDFSIKENGSMNIALGDATGHGMKAGTVVSMIKSLFTANSARNEIDEFFIVSNDGLKNSNLDKMMMAFAMLNIDTLNNIKIVNAGIPPIFIYRSKSKTVEEVNLNGLPLGAMRITNYKVYETKLFQGDIVLMLSDGMPELQNKKNEMFGYERIIDLFLNCGNLSSEEIIKRFKEEGSSWTQDNDPDDDITFVVIKVQ